MYYLINKYFFFYIIYKANMSEESEYKMVQQEQQIRKLALAEQKGQKMTGLDTETLITLNDLTYKMFINANCVKRRNLKPMYCQRSEYLINGSSNMIFDIQTGEEFVDWKNSWLTFTVRSSQDYKLNHGSAMNFINTLIVSSRSGEQLMYVRNINLFKIFHDRLTKSENWFKHQGKAMGYFILNGDGTYKAEAKNADHTYSIPMSEFEGVFNTHRLMPAYLSQGLRIELQIENYATAVQGTAATDAVIKNATMFLDCYELSDNVQHKLNIMSAENGLEFYYEDIFNTSIKSSETEVNIDIKKAVGMALNIITIPRLTANISNAATESLVAESSTAFPLNSYQTRFGGNYLPHQPARNVNDMYMNTLYSYRRIFGGDCNVSFDEYKSTDAAATDKGMCAVSTLLETSNLNSYTGAQLNTSRQVTITVGFTSGKARTIDTFLTYVRVCRVFLNNVVIRS
jgi:hypothetical protein